MFSTEIQNLIDDLTYLPGLGPRSAQRVALYLIANKSKIRRLSYHLKQVEDKIVNCKVCGNFDTMNPCNICIDARRDQSVLCVVETVGDLWAIERTNCFRGLYHVLGGALSALEGIGPEQLFIEGLWRRLKGAKITEVVLCLNPTLGGQTTANYLADGLRQYDVAITAIAKGVPLGSEVKYVDDGTLITAWHSRTTIKNIISSDS